LGVEKNSIDMILRRRGFTCTSKNPRENLIFPKGFSKKSEDYYYRLLKKYSFRLFLRDLIKFRDSFEAKDLSKYCSLQTSTKYIRTMEKDGIIKRIKGGKFKLALEEVKSFGDTFEWVVAKIFEREFGCPAAWNLTLKEARSGGDFDVIAFMEGNLVYLELKSSPPKHVEQKEVSAFFERVFALKPDLAIFLEDTHLRMKDKIVVLFETALQERFGKSSLKKFPVRRLVKELFAVGERLYIINSHRDIVSNIGFCLKSFLQRDREDFWE